MMIYIAGSLFTEAEIRQRKHEAHLLKQALMEKALQTGVSAASENIDRLVFNPIESPFNDKSTKPSAKEIFHGDYSVIKKSRYLLFNLDNILDTGVFLELGQALEMGKKVYPVISDMRMPNAGNYDAQYVPFGYNQYVIGALDYYDVKLYTSAESAIAALVQDYEFII